MSETAQSIRPRYAAARNVSRRFWDGWNQPQSPGEWMLCAAFGGCVLVVLAKALWWAVQGYMAILATDGAMDALLFALSM